MNLHTLLLKKTKGGSQMNDTETNYGVVVLGEEMPEQEVKDLEKQEWAGMDGEDVYIPAKLTIKSQALTVECGLKSSLGNWEDQMDAFVDYLTGHDPAGGTEMLLYLPYKRTGRKCFLSKISDIEPHVEETIKNKDVILTFTLEFSINQPRVRVQAVYDTDGVRITDLKERINERL